MVLLVSWAITIEMPIELPMLRIRRQEAVASVRNSPGSVAKATVFSGTKTKPRPKPWTMPDTMIVLAEVFGEKPSSAERDARSGRAR